MSGDIIDGLDQLLNQSTEDILPYYQKTETTPDTAYENLHESYYYDNTIKVEVFLQLILGCLTLLVIIVLIISMVLCAKLCNSNTNDQMGDSATPPAFIYVTPLRIT